MSSSLSVRILRNSFLNSRSGFIFIYLNQSDLTMMSSLARSQSPSPRKPDHSLPSSMSVPDLVQFMSTQRTRAKQARESFGYKEYRAMVSAS